MAVIPDIRIGDDYTLKINYPADVDIRGFKFYLTLKKSFSDLDSDAVLQVSHVAGSGDLDSKSSCFLTVPASKTEKLKKGGYLYGLQAISASGEIETLAPPIGDYTQKIAVIPSVTLASL
jgi:hypothetical protein